MKKIKDKRGFTGIDISIAIVIVIITIGIAVAMIGRISNQVREIEVDTIVNGKLGQEINEIQKRKAQGENLSGNVKTLTIENQVYDLYVNGDKVLIKKTVRGQQIDYREAELEKKTVPSSNGNTEEERLLNILDMEDNEYQDITFKVKLVMLESYYVGNPGSRVIKFRKKTKNLLEKDKLFGKDLGVFLATREDNLRPDGEVINNNEVRFWVPKIVEKRNSNPNISSYIQYVFKKLDKKTIDESTIGISNLNDIYKLVEYDSKSNKQYIYLDKNRKIEFKNDLQSEYRNIEYSRMLSYHDLEHMEKVQNPKGFWFKLRDDSKMSFNDRKEMIAELLVKDLFARRTNLREQFLERKIDISIMLYMISNGYSES